MAGIAICAAPESALISLTDGGVVSISNRSLILSPVSASPGGCGRRIRGDHLDAIAAVGNQRGVEAVCLVV